MDLLSGSSSARTTFSCFCVLCVGKLFMLSLFLSCPGILCRLRRSLFQNDRYYTCSFFFCISGGSTFLLSHPFSGWFICMNLSASRPGVFRTFFVFRSSGGFLLSESFLCRYPDHRSGSFLCRILIFFLADPSYMLIVASC